MTTRVRTVESAEEQRHGVTEFWAVVTRAKGDGGITHLFPKSVLEWRAAEYGVDPSDVDALLDMVLHEQLFDDMTAEDAKRGLGAARSTVEARTAHLERIAAVKAEHRVDVDTAGPLDVIRSRSGITAHGVRGKRELVDTHRWISLYGGLPVPVTDALEVPHA